VYLGLPLEYAKPVLEGVQAAAEVRSLGPGRLRFDYAAHAIIGSAPILFERLPSALLRLLSEAQMSEDQLTQLLRTVFSL
jgi:hypothetical protein